MKSLTPSQVPSQPTAKLTSLQLIRQVQQVNKELWLILSMFIIALLLNLLVDAQRMMLSFYTLPTLASAYLFGRRQATLTALASVLMVALLRTTTMGGSAANLFTATATWADLGVWGGTLHERGVQGDAAARREGRGDARDSRRLAPPGDPDRAGPSRQVQRLRLPPDERSGDSSRSARHLGGGCVRFLDQRPPLPESDVPVRREGHHRERHRHRLRPRGRGCVPGGLPVRRDGRAVGRRFLRPAPLDISDGRLNPVATCSRPYRMDTALTYVFSASARLAAPPERVYATIANYHTGHPRIVPKQYSGLAVQEGGIGEGTRIRFQVPGLRTTTHFRTVVPQP